jgi:hypothetical protein
VKWRCPVLSNLGLTANLICHKRTNLRKEENLTMSFLSYLNHCLASISFCECEFSQKKKKEKKRSFL